MVRHQYVEREDQLGSSVMRRWWLIIVAGALLAGCALPHTRVYVPDQSLKPDTVLGYQTEQNRHDIRLYPGEPVLVEMWVEEAFPFGQRRHSKWMTGPYPFTSDVWFPGGIPARKGESFGIQVYDGVKVEGGKYREFRRNGWSWTPLEFHAKSLCELRGIEDCQPSEQHGVRGKSDLEPGAVCPLENMAGC